MRIDFIKGVGSMEQSVGKAQVILVVMISVVCVSVGETLLAAGMRAVGRGGYDGPRFLVAALSSWHVWVGTVLMLAFFVLYALTLAWADLSFVLPLTAVSYITGAIFAQAFLHEPVSLTRWVGTILITLGVVVVGKGG